MTRTMVLPALLALSASLPAHATPCAVEGLGEATGYNVATIDAFTGRYSEVRGMLVAGGDVSLRSYGVGTSYYSDMGIVTLSAGGDVATTDVQVQGGDAEAAGSCALVRTNVAHGAFTCNTTVGVDGATLDEELNAVSDHVAGLAATHSASADPWGGVTLDATGSTGPVVFDLDLDAVKSGWSPWVSRINNFTVKAGSGVTVLINVSGDRSVFLDSHGFNLSGGVASDTVLLNFNGATSVDAKNIGIKASILAPEAELNLDSGNLDGTAAVHSFDGTGRFTDIPFDGEICVPYPESCDELAGRADGDYELVVDGTVIDIYCADLATSPKAYLPLSYTNSSQYYLVGRRSTVTSTYTKVRIDLDTLLVDTSDQRFATSTGSGYHGGTLVTSMPYGVAMDCYRSYSQRGKAKVDLRGTAFVVDDSWSHSGHRSAGSTTFSSSDQVVDITGGGFCGWNSTGTTFNPFNDRGGWDLQLDWL